MGAGVPLAFPGWMGVVKKERMKIPENGLGLQSFEELLAWTTTYFHFKQVLEVVALPPEAAQLYLNSFEEYRERLSQDLRKQAVLEARLPQEMREKIAAEKPNLMAIRELLLRAPTGLAEQG